MAAIRCSKQMNKTLLKRVLVICVAFGLVSAAEVLAQLRPSPTPLPHVKIGIPVKAPPAWDPKQWAAIRAHCQSIADRSAAHIAIGPRETSMVQTCGSLSSPPEIAEPSNTPNNAAVAPMSLPTPVATPQSSLVSRTLRTMASGAGSALPS